MNFYQDIAHRLYVQDTKIGDTVFHRWEDFLDAKNNLSDFPGKVFWANVQAAMVAQPQHFGLKLRGDFYLKVLEFCKQRINEIEIVPGSTDSTMQAINKDKPSIKAYAIAHVYLEKTGGQGITETNKKKLGDKYGWSSDKLRNEFRYYQDESNRLTLRIDNKKSASAHIRNFEKAVKILQTQSQVAFEMANNDLFTLNKQFIKHHS
jgi:hypothetical protein